MRHNICGMKNNEAALLAGARRLDRQALSDIYDFYSPRLYTYAARLMGDARQAEDCVAETFARFLAALQKKRGPRDHLQAYLYRVAHNLVVDAYRRKQPLEESLNEEMTDHSAVDPETDTMRYIESRRLRAALSQLTAEQSQVLALRFLEDWEISEVAAALNKPPGAVKALQHRGLRALRRALGGDGG